MNEAKKALEDIKNELFGHYDFKDISDCGKERFSIIKQALDEGEEAKEVLEIIKNKPQDSYLVILHYWKGDTFETFQRKCILNQLTETEFNLIKERLEKNG